MLVTNSKKWSYVKISEICDFKGGGTPSKQEPTYWNGNINWASVKDIKGDFLESTQEFITPQGLKNSAASLAKPGEVILITRISPGKTILSKIETAINQDLKIIIPKVKTHPKFLHYYFQSIQKKIIELSSGTTVLGITLNSLNEIEIPRLSFEEQQTIVYKIEELFSELDKGIETLRLAQQQLKVYRQSVLKWAFEGRLTNEDVKEGKLPEGWKWKTISDVCDMKAGNFIKASEIKEDFEEGLYACYGGNGIRGYVKSYTHEGIFPLVGRQGALCGNVHLVNGKFHATEHAVVVSVKEDIEVRWLYFKLISMRLNQYSAGAAQPGLSVNKLLPIKLIVPSKEEQEYIVSELDSRFSQIDKMEESITQSLQQAEVMRQSILKRAFEGRLINT